MNLTINFFENNLINAIGADIYEIEVQANNKVSSLYIGESIFVMVRCACHLHELKKNPKYFGFDENTINDNSITLIFKVLENDDSKLSRKEKKLSYIKKLSPLSQSKINDRQKNIEDKVEALKEFLNSTLVY